MSLLPFSLLLSEPVTNVHVRKHVLTKFTFAIIAVENTVVVVKNFLSMNERLKPNLYLKVDIWSDQSVSDVM